MITKDREQLLKTRQKLIDLIRLCEWDLIFEKYPEASEKIDDTKKIMDRLIVDLVVDALS
jgi:hypothetical protein